MACGRTDLGQEEVRAGVVRHAHVMQLAVLFTAGGGELALVAIGGGGKRRRELARCIDELQVC